MKKILATAATAAILATSSFAADNSPYLIAGAGLEMLTDYDMGVALIIGGGMPLDVKVGPGKLAVEGELTYSAMAPSYSYSGATVDFTAMTLAGYAAYSFDLSKEMFIKPRLGLIYRSYDFASNYSGYGSYGGFGSYTEFGIALGVQGGYKLSKEMDLIAGLNLVDGADLIHITAGIQYHF